MKTYEPQPGNHIDIACQTACQMAKQSGETVIFQFNEVELTATPASLPNILAHQYSDECDRRRLAYEASPEGVEDARMRKEAVETAQRQVDALTKDLPTTIRKGNDAVIEWLDQFHRPADDVEVKSDYDLLLGIFEAAGYKANAHVGDTPESFNTRPKMAEYIVGQAMSCMKRFMPPHPVLASFCEKYRQLT